MIASEIKKGQSYKMVDLIDYVPEAVATRNLVQKATGHILLLAVDTGQSYINKVSRFDIFVEILEGSAEITIEGSALFLETGDSIIIPAHSGKSICAVTRLKMVHSVIKSGYEDV